MELAMDTPTASERLLAAVTAFWSRVSALTYEQLAINLALSAGVVAAAFVAGVLFRRLIQVGVRRVPGAADAVKHVRTSRVARFTRAVIRVALAIFATIGVAKVWGLNIGDWLSQGLGERLVGLATHLAILLVIGFAAFELAGFLVDRLLNSLENSTESGRRSAQIHTIAPLLRSVARGAVSIVFLMMMLSEAGVKIGPLLAGAGVVGIAVGFGAQTLVKDFLTGLFLIVEDIVSVGDIVQIEGSGGLVEQMTLRTIRLRDFDGTLHIFPYSEAQVIHNLTKTFSYAVFDLQISYGSDIDRALAVMKGTGAEMLTEKAFAEKILEPIEVVGVDGLGESGVRLKARIKTAPLEQWNVGREYNRRIKLAFDRERIEIPYPHMQLVLPDGDGRLAERATPAKERVQ
jgi:small conductance mechanosensitive channel